MSDDTFSTVYLTILMILMPITFYNLYWMRKGGFDVAESGVHNTEALRKGCLSWLVGTCLIFLPTTLYFALANGETRGGNFLLALLCNGGIFLFPVSFFNILMLFMAYAVTSQKSGGNEDTGEVGCPRERIMSARAGISLV